MHLAELQLGDKATVIGVAQGEAFCQLCALGLTSGAEVEVVRSLSGRALLVVRVDGSDIALRRETAQTVKIAPTHVRAALDGRSRTVQATEERVALAQ